MNLPVHEFRWLAESMDSTDALNCGSNMAD